MIRTEARTSRVELIAAISIASLLTVAWFLLADHYQALGIARNDDWSYLENAFRFADTGIFAVGGWVQMMLIGQLLLAIPVIAIAGNSVAALQMLVGALGAITLVCSYLVLRNFLNRRWSAFSTLALAGSALYGLLSVSFMTDVPAAAFQLLTLALAYRALRGDGVDWLWLSLASLAGVVALSIREYAIVALVAIWLVTARRVWSTSNRPKLLLLTGIIAALVAALILWRQTQVTVTENSLAINLYGLRYLAWWPLTAGWLLLPAIAVINPQRALARAWAASRTLTVLAGVGALAAMAHTRLSLLGNYLSLSGGYSEVIRGNPEPVLPNWWAWPMTVAAAYSALVLAIVLVPVIMKMWTARGDLRHERRSPTALAATFVTLSVLIYVVVPVLAETALFDRYFIAALPVAAGLILWWASREELTWTRPLTPAVAALSLSTVTSIVLVAATSALDGVRWQLGYQVAQDLGVANGNIDAGFDFFDFNTNGGPRPDGIRWTWWTAQLGDRAVCATITYADFAESTEAAGPDPDARPLTEVPVAVPLANDQRIVVFEGPDRC